SRPQLLENRASVVGGIVVDDDNFPGTGSLDGRKTGERVAEGRGAIARGDDDGDHVLTRSLAAPMSAAREGGSPPRATPSPAAREDRRPSPARARSRCRVRKTSRAPQCAARPPAVLDRRAPPAPQDP